MLSLRSPFAKLVPFLLGGLVAAGFVIWVDDAAKEGAPNPPPGLMRAGAYDWRANPIGPGAEKTIDLPLSIDSLPFEPLLPKMDDGSADIRTVWTRIETEPAIAVKLQSGVFIMEGVAESLDFPTSEFYTKLADGVPGASTTEINGAPAMVIQSTDQLGNPSSVDVILVGVRISIIGDVGQDTSELVALASTIPASGAGPPIETDKT